MSAPRFLADGLDGAGGEIVLAPDESHHLARVLRLAADDEVVLFDGRGRAVRAVVVRPDHRHTSVRAIEELPPDPEPRVPIVLVQSILKGDNMDGVVRDATMAGVARIVPVVTARSQIRLPALERTHARERWQRIAVASAKQCRRARLPAIDAPRQLDEWLGERFDGVRLFFAEPEAADESVGSLRTALAGSLPAAAACVVGPEGGWSVEERQRALGAGCVAVTLGPTTYRADAAGLVAAALVTFVFQEA